ncbi:MAG: response regulator [Candidatus Omnitrophica bacterium]|nr:response regulator [Candidatus Omnitrophota bacterium]
MNDKGLGVRLLLADDDRPTRIMLRQRISDWGYEIEEADNGQSALEILTGDDPPRMAVLDWIMPGLDGVEVCQRVASRSDTPFIYTILLTRRSEKEDLVQALDSGAHDFLTKPVDINELRSRLDVGRRLIEADQAVRTAEKEKERVIVELQQALSHIKTLSGLLPICAHCKKIRDDQGYWTQLEQYIHENSDASFSHSICPECAKEHFPDLYPELEEHSEKEST